MTGHNWEQLFSCIRVNKFWRGTQKPVFLSLLHVCLEENHLPEWLPCWKKTPFPIKSPLPRAGHDGPVLDIPTTALRPGHSNPACPWNVQLFKVKLNKKNVLIQMVFNEILKCKKYIYLIKNTVKTVIFLYNSNYYYYHIYIYIYTF